MLTIRESQITVFEQDARRRIASAVLDDLRESAPHVVAGLDNTELAGRLDTAIGKATQYRIDMRDAFEAFVRLSFVVGPHFDEYPPFQEILLESDAHTRIFALMSYALPEDWEAAGQFDIVKRYRNTARHTGGVRLVPLDNSHVDAYFHYARHPDVWRLAKMTPMATRADTCAFMQELDDAADETGYAIVDDRQAFLGACIVSRGRPAAEVLYWVARPLWGQGIASQALAQLKERHAGERLALHIDARNTPSRKVASTCGFRQRSDDLFEASHGE